MSNVFISYRREDTAAYAGRLCDRLSALFGAQSVFMDVQDIRPGQDFALTIDDTLAKCHVLIAVIGPRWLDRFKAPDPNKEDFVRDEIAEALRKNLTVIPVLVGGAKIPEPGELPESVRPLGRYQAVEIRDTRFDEDFAELAKVLAKTPGLVMSGSIPGESSTPPVIAPHSNRRWRWFGAAGVVLASISILFIYMMRPGAPDLGGAWIAEMHKEGQPVYRIRLDLIVSDGAINGTVDYPTGKGVIEKGTVTASRIAFQTTHTPEFASSPATIRFQGEVEGTTIHLTSVDDNGIAAGLAERIPRSTSP